MASSSVREEAVLRIIRHEIGVQFAVYEAAHAGGVPLEDKDPAAYIRRHAG